LANALKSLGCEEAMVVHGLDGLDEISTVGTTIISHLKDGEVNTFEAPPQFCGTKPASVADLEGATPQENAVGSSKF
jgi:anthranilate phosphoribosyltransferase